MRLDKGKDGIKERNKGRKGCQHDRKDESKDVWIKELKEQRMKEKK